MRKRPPEMERLTRFEVDMDGSMDPDKDGDWVRREIAEAAIRSLRVKLFRERACWHGLLAESLEEVACTPTGHSAARWERKAEDRFTRIADAIARGEK